MLPDCTVHGVWVRSLVHDGFGRISYKVTDRLEDGSVEFMIMWEPDPDLDGRRPIGGYHSPEDLMVRPYKPKPWYTGRYVKEVVHNGIDDVRGSEPLSEV